MARSGPLQRLLTRSSVFETFFYSFAFIIYFEDNDINNDPHFSHHVGSSISSIDIDTSMKRLSKGPLKIIKTKAPGHENVTLKTVTKPPTPDLLSKVHE